MPKKAKKQEVETAPGTNKPKPSTAPAAKVSKKRDAFATYPVPRQVCADPELTDRYVKPGYLQFINGNDRAYLTQTLDWASTWPDSTRPYYAEEERKSALPSCSWPPSFVLIAPEQQVEGTITKPVHGGWTWPGHPAPRLPTIEGFVQGLPGPLKKFFA